MILLCAPYIWICDLVDDIFFLSIFVWSNYEKGPLYVIKYTKLSKVGNNLK